MRVSPLPECATLPDMEKHECEKLAKAAQAKQSMVRFPVKFNVAHEESMGVCNNWRVTAMSTQKDRRTAPRTTVTSMEEVDAFVAAVVAGTAPAHDPGPELKPFAEAVADFMVLAEKNGITIDKREGWRSRNGM